MNKAKEDKRRLASQDPFDRMITRVAQNAFSYFKNNFFQERINNLAKFNETEFEELSEKIIDNALVIAKDIVNEPEKRIDKDSSLWAAYNPETPLEDDDDPVEKDDEPVEKDDDSEDSDSDLALLSQEVYDELFDFDNMGEMKTQWSDIFGKGICSLCRMNINVLNKAA